MYPSPHSVSDTAPPALPSLLPQVAVLAVQQVLWSADMAVPTLQDAPAQNAAAAPVLNVYPDPHAVDTVAHRASAVQHVLWSVRATPPTSQVLPAHAEAMAAVL